MTSTLQALLAITPSLAPDSTIKPPSHETQDEVLSSLAILIFIMLLLTTLFTSFYLKTKRINAIHETVVSTVLGNLDDSFQIHPYFTCRSLLLTLSFITAYLVVHYRLPCHSLLLTLSFITAYLAVHYCLPCRSLPFTLSFITVYPLIHYYLLSFA